MAKQTINVGTTANDRTGDPLRTAFTKVNENFTELYSNVATLSSSVVTDISDLTDTTGLLFSGEYTALSNTPFIATDISDLTDTNDLLIVREYIELTGTLQGSNTVITFEKAPNTDSNTIFDQITNFISITRDIGGDGIYNSALEGSWDPVISPLFTIWNSAGWDNLLDIETRYYVPFRQVLDNIDLNIIGAELIMKDSLLNEYYKVKFTEWAQGTANTGAFAYTREKIDTTIPVGITFADGTKLPTAPDTRVRFEQSYIGDYSGHVLNISEAGRQVYIYDNIVEIPSYNEQNFKLGDTIQIITGETASTIRPKVYDNIELPDANLYIQGETTATSSFAIPARSMALLTKIRENTWQLSIGESDITGDITFDTNKIIGAGANSGDGNNYNTIQLVPDISLYDNDQYLIIDPTEPSHIHLRAGGSQDNSNALLFLGAEQTHVMVSDYNHSVNIKTWDGDTTNFDWSFGTDGSVTFPDNEVQTTAYSGGQGHMFMIDTNRTDTYTEVGNADKPFKTFAAAIAAADEIDTTATFVLMGCTITEDVDFANTSFTSITIATSCRSAIDGNITITDVPAMSQMFFRNIEVGGTFTITGDGTNEQFNSVNFYNTSFTGPVNITATNATAFYEVSFFDTANFTNLSYLYINGAQFNADWTITADSTGVIPSRGIDPNTGGSIAIVFGTIANDVNFVKGGTAVHVFQPHMSRLGRSGQTYTVPADWTMTPHSAVLRGSWVNNGTTLMRNSSSDNEITGTAPSYVGTIGASIIKIEDGVHEKFQTKVDATGTVTHDCSAGHIFYHTSPDANWTANFTNLNLSSTYATAVTIVIVQGGTGYYPTALEIGGVSQTINWQGNGTPTPSINRVDVVTFSILNNSGTYTILGQLTGF